jgi:hypothetical protein
MYVKGNLDIIWFHLTSKYKKLSLPIKTRATPNNKNEDF